MIEQHWKRIAGLQVQEDGTIGLVWIAHDKESDVIHLYDACRFRREVLAVVAEGINARGRWIPLAWHKDAKEIADKLLEKGCNMLPEPVPESQAVVEAASREIWGRMRSQRFKVDKRLGEWIEEMKSFELKEGKVPRDTHPLMSATRHAVEQLSYARRQAPKGKKAPNFPKLATI